METLKKIVRNQYFPAGAVLTAVVLFWAVGLLGGLSLLHNNQPPLTTLTWMLFVYMAAVLTPLAGTLAAVDLVRRWRRNHAAETAPAETADAETARAEAARAGQAEDTSAEEEPAVAPASDAAENARAAVTSPAPTPAQPKKNSKQAGRKQAA